MLYSLLAPLLVTSPSPLEPLRPPLDARADIDTANARAEIRIQLKNGATIKHITHQYKHPDFNADSYSIQPDVGMKPNNKKYYYREQLDPWGKKAEGTLPPLGEAEYNGVKGQRVDTYLTVLAGNKKMRVGLLNTFLCARARGVPLLRHGRPAGEIHSTVPDRWKPKAEWAIMKSVLTLVRDSPRKHQIGRRQKAAQQGYSPEKARGVHHLRQAECMGSRPE
jgi:hypothetical protein